MKITDVTQAEKVLQEYIPNVATYSGDDLSLSRMWPILEALGNPQDNLKVIHIAGTSGKTSTAYYIAALLGSGDSKVGLTVSPHVDSITERVQVAGKPLSDSVFCRELGEFIELIKGVEQTPSYFELMIAFALWEFVRRGVDYAVIETGMGGLLDSTNVVTRKDKLCVITDIGFDHTHVLGNTLPKIAEQKAGIIHNDNHVFMYEQPSEIIKQVKSRVEKVGAHLETIDPKVISLIATKLQLEILPIFQRRNWTLASIVARAVEKRDNIQINLNLDPLTIVVPGRMEQRKLGDNSILIMDGAHNKQKITAFVGSYQDMFPGHKALVMLGLKEGKEYKEVIDIIGQITDSFILTTFSTSQDLPAVSQDPETIAEQAKNQGIKYKIIRNHNEAYAELVKSPQKIKIVIGSLYLLSQIR